MTLKYSDKSLRARAEVLGMTDKVGSLEPGKKADLQFIDLKSPHIMPTIDVARANASWKEHQSSVNAIFP